MKLFRAEVCLLLAKFCDKLFLFDRSLVYLLLGLILRRRWRSNWGVIFALSVKAKFVNHNLYMKSDFIKDSYA